MDKYQQIVKLAEASQLIQEVLQHCDPDYAEDLEDARMMLADVADQIEGFEI